MKFKRRQKEIEMTLMERAMDKRVEQIVAKRIQAEAQMRETIIEREIEKRLEVERKKQEAIIEKEVDARIKIEMKRREELIEIEVKRRVRDARSKMEQALKEKDQKETQLDYLNQLNSVCPPLNK